MTVKIRIQESMLIDHFWTPGRYLCLPLQWMFSGTFIDQLQKLPPLLEPLQSRLPGPSPKLFHFDRVLCHQTWGDLQVGARRGAMDIGGRMPNPEIPRYVNVYSTDERQGLYFPLVNPEVHSFEMFFHEYLFRGPWSLEMTKNTDYGIKHPDTTITKKLLLFDSLVEYLLFLYLPTVQFLPILSLHSLFQLLYIFHTIQLLTLPHCPAFLLLSGFLSYTHFLTQIIFEYMLCASHFLRAESILVKK